MLSGWDSAEHVAHRGERQHFGAVEQLIQIGEIELTVGGQADPADLDSTLLCEHLPWHDVGVVLHLGEDDHIADAEVGPTPGHGNEVHRLGGVLGEDDLVDRWRVDQARNRVSGTLIRLGCLARKPVRAAVDRRVGLLHERRHHFDDSAGLLGCVARVEVDQPSIIDSSIGQQWEFGSDRVYVEHFSAPPTSGYLLLELHRRDIARRFERTDR